MQILLSDGPFCGQVFETSEGGKTRIFHRLPGEPMVPTLWPTAAHCKVFAYKFETYSRGGYVYNITDKRRIDRRLDLATGEWVDLPEPLLRELYVRTDYVDAGGRPVYQWVGDWVQPLGGSAWVCTRDFWREGWIGE